ncbi:MAG: DNA polymerase III [Treponema sp.]|jgi:DNA polymerase-3 subunit gamma/tau|nr:DNA polymerase III [Treponema sp.]
MFENILHQEKVVNQLKTDIISGTLAPSILFSGPEYSGKGTTALELARALCCEEESRQCRWNCNCPSCIRHRNLFSPDMLLLGKRCFFVEIAASSGAFLRNPENSGTKILFFRSVRKLLARFNDILWEDDPKLGKLKTQIIILEDELEEVESSGKEGSRLAKKCESISKKAAKLETVGLGELISIAQIRRAAYWSHLVPLGRQKCVIIENAENMLEGAKNSLLKILEEPPESLTLILTSSRPNSLLPTVLSRLREYRFIKRSPEAETDVLNRIFRESSGKKQSLESYFTSFLPVKNETLYALGAYLFSSVAAKVIRELHGRGNKIPDLLADFGKFSALIAEAGGVGRSEVNSKDALGKILDMAEHFEIPGLFTKFLQQCTGLVSAWLQAGMPVSGANYDGIEKIILADRWMKKLNRSRTENDSYNISPPMVLERLFEELKKGII